MAHLKLELEERLHSKQAVIGVIGLGYVGLPLALRYVEQGFKVVGFDVSPDRLNSIRRGISPIRHIDSKRVSAANLAGLEITDGFSRAAQCDALILCVPTPLTKHREPDMTYILGAMESLMPFLRAGHIVSLESTTYPGTTEELLMPMLEKKSGIKVGENCFLVFSPEREDPGNKNYNTQTIPKVVSGMTAACRQLAIALYQGVVDQVVPVSSPKVAEMTKLLENIHRSVNIGLVNEMKIICDRMGIDVFEVIQAAATKPFGFVPYAPGPGLGGHCIPIDPFYLTWKAREYGVHTRFIELAGEVNRAMPEWVVSKVTEALNARGRAVHGARVLILGVAYKKDVDDARESPSHPIMGLLKKLGAQLEYSDPYFLKFPNDHEGPQFHLDSVAVTKERLQNSDVVLLVTNHTQFDYPMIYEFSPLIIDTRGVYSPGPKVVRA